MAREGFPEGEDIGVDVEYREGASHGKSWEKNITEGEIATAKAQGNQGY